MRLDKTTALKGVWAYAELELKELPTNTDNSPKTMFCLGYLFGCAFGLALSTVRKDLVKTFVPVFNKRGWLSRCAYEKRTD
jgi:hypothetical protein